MHPPKTQPSAVSLLEIHPGVRRSGTQCSRVRELNNARVNPQKACEVFGCTCHQTEMHGCLVPQLGACMWLLSREIKLHHWKRRPQTGRSGEGKGEAV